MSPIKMSPELTAKLLEQIGTQLKAQGIDLECADPGCCVIDGDATHGANRGGEKADGSPRIKVVCVAPNLKDSVEELCSCIRDQVVMVRIDEETSKTLDAWVETGSVRSRSEAAALFIREGLKVRAVELEKLREAIGHVEEARRKLRDRARQVLGQMAIGSDSGGCC